MSLIIFLHIEMGGRLLLSTSEQVTHQTITLQKQYVDHFLNCINILINLFH